MAEVPFLDLGRQVAALRGELDAAVASVLDGGRFVLDEHVARFEEAFAAECGAGHAVGVGSGTDAIGIALRALGVGPGDEVIAPGNTCPPTVAGIVASGATPVLADAEPVTFGLDPERLEERLTPRTRAIVVVHLYGQCADMAPILDLARRHGVRVVEDAAHAHGATYRGVPAGVLGDVAAFSFYPTKNLGALGDGGAVVTDDDGVAQRVRELRGSVYSRLDALQASLLLAKLPHLGGWIERRRLLAGRYREGLGEADVELPEEAADRRHAYHLFVVRSARRDRVRQQLREDGIETLVHYAPALGPLPVSERLARTVFSLPLYPELTDGEQERVISALARATTRVYAPS